MYSKYLPTISELRASLKLRSKEYLRENSLHGLPYVMDPTKRTYARVGWLICVLVSLVAAICTSCSLWNKFQTSPILTGIGFMADGIEIYFPNVFLCLNWKLFPVVNDSKLDPGTEPYLKQLYEWDWERSVNISWMESGYAIFFKDLAPACKDLFTKSSYKTADLLEKVVTPSGICCKFKGKLVKEEDTERILRFETKTFPLNLGFYLTGQHDTTLPLFEQPTLDLINGSSISFNAVTTMTNKDVRLLSVNQRQCTFDDESVSYSHCERNCFINKIRSICHCLPWFLAPSPEEECKPVEYSCLIRARKMFLTLDCNCFLPCDHTAYNVHIIERKPHKQIIINFKPWPHLLYKRKISFGWVDLAASFGGIAGFFLGFSVLTSFELWYYFTLRTYCGVVLSAPKKGISIAVKEAPKKLLKKKGKNYKNFEKEVKFFEKKFAN